MIDIPVWLQDLNGIAGVIGAIAGLIAAVRSSKAAAAADKAAASADKTAAQVTPNGGGSMRDSVTRTEADVSVIRASLEALTNISRSQGHQIGEIRRDLTAAVDRHETDVARLDRAIERQSDRPGDGVA